MDPKKEQFRRWQEAIREMNEWASEECLSAHPCMEATWVAQDLAQSAGWLIAIGFERKLPSCWKTILGGKIALSAGEAVISDLHNIKEELSKLIKIPLPEWMTPQQKLVCVLQSSFSDLLAASENEILHQRLWCWAAGISFRRLSSSDPLGKVRLTIADDNSQFIRFLSVLEQTEAETDEVLANPILKIWLQEEVLKVKQEPIVKLVIEAGIAELPRIFL